MQNNVLLTLVKVEGLGNPEFLECVFQEESLEIKTVPASSFPVSVSVNPSSVFRILINDNESKVLVANLAFSSNLLEKNWFYWLPLSIYPEHLITSLPCAINSPKILIAVNKDYLDYEQPLSDPCSDEDQAEGEAQIPPYLIQQFQVTIKSLQLELLQTRKIFKQKIHALTSRLEKCRSELQTEKNYRSTLQDQLERCYKVLANNEYKDFNFEVSPINKSEFLLPRERSFAVFNSCQEEENSHFQSLLDYNGRFETYLDGRVREILRKLKFEGLLKKCHELNYRVGSKIVTICLKNGEICCKSGLSLERYIFSCCKREIEELIRQRSSPPKRSPRKFQMKTSFTPMASIRRLI